MRAFRAEGDGVVSTELEPVEATLLTQLAAQVAGLLGNDRDVGARGAGAVTDPAIVRLLPDAYPGDREASEEFRRFTAAGLTERKVRNASTVIAGIAPALNGDRATSIRLDADDCQAWLRALTDIRLVIATRLGIGTDDSPDPDVSAPLADVYDWLGWVQDSLVNALDG